MIAVNNYSTTCPFCGGGALDRVYAFDEFSVMRCGRCDNSWRTNMYTEEIITQMYCEEDYDQHPFFAFAKQETEQPSGARFKNFQRALAYIESSVGAGKIIDIACGSGAFLAMAERRGWDAYGVEISPALCDVCRANTGARIYNAAFEEAELPAGVFDAVTMWDIIEHVLDPIAFIQKARSLLRPGGLLLLCTPDEDSLLARTGWALYKGTRASYRYPALALHPRYHTFFFSRRSLGRLLERQGLTVTRAYSQQAFFQHSPLASQAQKRAIGLIEKVAATFGACYECVLIARA